MPRSEEQSLTLNTLLRESNSCLRIGYLGDGYKCIAPLGRRVFDIQRNIQLFLRSNLDWQTRKQRLRRSRWMRAVRR